MFASPTNPPLPAGLSEQTTGVAYPVICYSLYVFPSLECIARHSPAIRTYLQVVFASRVQEGKDVRAGLENIQAKLKVLQDEADALRKKLAQVE